MRERIAEFIREKAYRPMTFDELATAMGIAEKEHEQLRKTMEQMESTGEVVLTRRERYGAPEKMNLAVGRLQGHPKGFGFLIQDAPGSADIFVGRESLNGAWHGDRIMARLSPPDRADGRLEGEVIRILHRANQKVVGTFEAAKNGGFVTPDDRRLAEDIFVPKGATNGSKSGEKVVVQVVRWPESRRNAEGKVVERIGMKGQVGVDIVSVIRKFGLPEVFPGKVLQEADAFAETVSPEAITEGKRRDLRDLPIVTIDGEDAKDLDDAVYVERTGESSWKLGVHIADVSFYVKEGTALDREAYQRATSVYLADRVVPMLPPKLSNGLCSLNPQVDRLTLSCVMEINADGQVQRYEIFPSVIKTVARMTYTKVNAILGGDAEGIGEHKALFPMFREMQTLMEVLRKKRMRRGSLDFDLPEAKVRLNDEGWPVEIQRVDRGITERIIEEFMLVANETVAQHCNVQKVPFMYRIHGEPASDRLMGLRDFLQLFGYNLALPSEGVITPKQLQGVTEWAQDRPEANLINSVLLRTMRQAIYSNENHGHFGLAADYYCHFTSPIRRYPDLVVHRVLRAMASGGLSAKIRNRWEKWMPGAAAHSSDRERVAVEAERETIDLKKAEFMSDKVGEEFEAIISGVSSFGFFVQLPNTVEGLVHISSLTDDYYHFHDRFYALVGERTRRRLRLGDKVTVRLTRADIDSRQVDFEMVLEKTPAIIVDPPSRESRSRAEKKQAVAMPISAGAPKRVVPVPAVPVPTAPSATDAGSAPVGAAPAAGAAETASPSGRKRRRKKPNRATAQEDAAAMIAIAQEEPLPKPERPAAPVAPDDRKSGPAARPVAREPVRGDKAERVEPKIPAVDRSPKLDMWGLPVPEGRVNRSRFDVDPGVINPFSVTVSRNDRGSRTLPSARKGPAPATADESAGLLSAPTAPTAESKKRRTTRRPPRSRDSASGPRAPKPKP